MFHFGKFSGSLKEKIGVEKISFLFFSISSLIESELIARLRRGLEEVIAVGDDGYIGRLGNA